MASKNTMTVSEAVKERRSIRRFKRSPSPSEADIRELLEKASRSPSGGNIQPWHVYVVSGEKRDEIVEKVRASMDQGQLGDESEYKVYPNPEDSSEYMDRRRRLALALYAKLGIARNDVSARTKALLDNYDFFGAPLALIVTVDRLVDRNGWGHVGMFLQTFCLLCTEAGLATCLQEAWGNWSLLLRDALEIPSSQIVWCACAVGFPDPSAPVNSLVSERLSVDDFCRFFSTRSSL